MAFRQSVESHPFLSEARRRELLSHPREIRGALSQVGAKCSAWAR